MEDKNCRRCSKPIEKVKSCGKENCPYWNPRDMWGTMIKRDLKLNSIDKYLVENLCNNCSDKLEDILAAFYNCKASSKELGSAGGCKDRWEYDTKTQKIKVWERSKMWEFDTEKQSLENILDSMNFNVQQNEIKSKLIKCCNLTQLCAFFIHFHHDRLKKNNLSNHTKFISLGAIDTVWNIYINLQDNQALCNFCLKFVEQLVRFRNDLAKGSGEKLCEFCGRVVWGTGLEYKKKTI